MENTKCAYLYHWLSNKKIGTQKDKKFKELSKIKKKQCSLWELNLGGVKVGKCRESTPFLEKSIINLFSCKFFLRKNSPVVIKQKRFFLIFAKCCRVSPLSILWENSKNTGLMIFVDINICNILRK